MDQPNGFSQFGQSRIKDQPQLGQMDFDGPTRWEKNPVELPTDQRKATLW